jgi:hypothetical protein
MLPNIDQFILCLEEYRFLKVFDKWETYLWSNFPFNHTWDIDVIFIGEPSEELGEKILDFQKYVKDKTEMKIDDQVFEDTKVFRHIENYNRTGDMQFDGTVLKYKTVKHDHRKPIYHNQYLWKYVLSDTSVKNKFRVGKTNMHYPILIEDFVKLVFNIQNQHIYNTEKDLTLDKYRNLYRDFRKHLAGE